jgi:hypothetical protein
VHQKVNHSDKGNPFVSPDGTHTNRIEASWRPAKDYFRDIRLRSVCDGCQAKMKKVTDEYKMQSMKINQEAIRCAECDGASTCSDHKKQHQYVKKDMRKKLLSLYNEREGCPECQALAEKFCEKLVEYLWRRQMKKEGRNVFMEVVAAIKDNY